MKLPWSLAWAGMVATLVAAFGAACTARNPRYCGDGVCTDPAYPFCDTTALFGDLQQQCVAVACTPGELAACRGDDELRCNDTGTNYDVTRCELGCDPAGGCRLCEPNQTACTNGTVATCDAAGTVTASEPCPLGCFESEPRCREIDPSNGLAAYLDMAAAGPDLVLEDATIELPSGRVVRGSNPFVLASTLVPAPASGVPLQIFPVRSLTIIGDLQLRSVGSHPDGVPAVAFMVHGEARIDGRVRLSPSTEFNRIAAPPGAVVSGPCVGTPGNIVIGGVGYFAGGGGGGGATQGGAGGSHWQWSGSPGGSAFPNADLQPLRGGCQGGTPSGQPPTHGGGALQITSRVAIRLGPNSAIYANGDAGTATPPEPGEQPGVEAVARGGGSGGGILLEAPVVVLETGTVLSANGGGGASGDGRPASSTADAQPSLGGVCVFTPCTSGGDGGSSAGPGRSASSISTTGLQEVYTGAGGGAAGHIRINSRNGVYTKANDAVETPLPSAGTLATR